MATFKPSDFNKKVAFGTTQTVKNPATGSSQMKFVADFSVWYAPKTRTLNQQYQLQGTSLENTKVIVIRHNGAVESQRLAEIDSVTYDIVSYSPDETNNYIKYDFVTLKRRS